MNSLLRQLKEDILLISLCVHRAITSSSCAPVQTAPWLFGYRSLELAEYSAIDATRSSGKRERVLRSPGFVAHLPPKSTGLGEMHICSRRVFWSSWLRILHSSDILINEQSLESRKCRFLRNMLEHLIIFPLFPQRWDSRLHHHAQFMWC